MDNAFDIFEGDIDVLVYKDNNEPFDQSFQTG